MARRSRYRRPPPSQNNAAVFAIVGIVVVVAIALFFVMSSGSGEDDAQPTQIEEPKPKPKKDPKADARNKARWWLDEKFYDEYGKQRTLTGRQIHDLVVEAEDKGYDKLLGEVWTTRLKNIYERLLKREPHDPDANRAFGRIPLSDYGRDEDPEGKSRFFKTFKRMSDEKALEREFAEVRDKYEGLVLYGPHWRTPAVPKEEFDRVAAVLRRYEAFAEEMDKSPARKAIYEALARVKLDPILGEYETVHIERPPFVLFYAHKDLTKRKDTRAEEERVARKRKDLEGKLDSYTQLLNDYLAFFKKTWIDPLELPAFKPDQLFYIWMFDDRKRFDAFGRSINQPQPPGVLGYFSHRDHWVYLYEPAKERIKVEMSLCHELTHQLHWHFSKDEGHFNNHFARSKATWFKEGWAEYVGWNEKKNGRFEFCKNAPARMDIFHICRKGKLPVYPIRNLIRSEDYFHHVRSVGINVFNGTLIEGSWLQKELKKRGLMLREGGWAIAYDVYLAMLYSEGWLFLKFLYEYKGGKYKQKTLKFTKANLKGYAGYTGARGFAQAHEVFEQIFDLKTDAAWAAFQKEFDEFLEQKMYEIPPTKR